MRSDWLLNLARIFLTQYRMSDALLFTSQTSDVGDRPMGCKKSKWYCTKGPAGYTHLATSQGGASPSGLSRPRRILTTGKIPGAA